MGFVRLLEKGEAGLDPQCPSSCWGFGAKDPQKHLLGVSLQTQTAVLWCLSCRNPTTNSGPEILDKISVSWC